MAQRNTRSKGASNQRRNAPRKKNAAAKTNTNVKTKNTKPVDKIEKNTERSETNAAENSLALNIAPFILIIIAIYILVSFFVNGAESVGVVGFLSRNMFYGLFGAVAVLIPFIMGSIAFFLKKDMADGFFKYRIIFSVICLILYASVFHLPSKESIDGVYEYSSLKDIFDNGVKSIGGGVLGGYLAETLLKIVGQIGAWIFIISLSVVFSTFLFGYTPAGVVKLIAKLVRDYKTSGRGFERKIIVKSPDPNRRYKTTTHRYKISSNPFPNSRNSQPNNNNGNINNGRTFQADISIETVPKNKKNRTGINISDNPFANDFTDETDKIENRNKITETSEPLKVSTGLQRSYETPLMLPEQDLFVSGANNNISKNSSSKLNQLNKNEASSVSSSLSSLGGLVSGVDINKDVNFESDDSEDIKIVESAPLSRDDEPDIDTGGANKKPISFETSKVFEDDAPVKKEYKLPPITYLTKDTSTVNVDISEELNTTAKKLTDTLKSFGVNTRIKEYSRGPSITRYEISPESGVKVNSIVNLVNDISLNLAAEVRIEAPIPGKAAIGVEVPNKIREIVHLRTLLEEQKFTNAASRITIALGEDVAGNPIYSDIAKMPHLLIAGATGMGKSVCMNSIIISILYKAKPDEVKMILIDPKKVELNIYNGLPHLLVPVVSDPKKAAGALSWAVNEMENRYMLIEEKGVRDIKAYNESIAGDPLVQPLPQIVIIVDELADLMLTAPADVEQSINRLAAKARAAGLHLIVATQRPSVDIITGLIKANIPTRIAFTVTAPQDSRTIINMGGAEKLIGNGDMLYVPTGTKPIRVQGAYVSEKDVLNVVDFWKKQSDGEYDENILNEIEQEAARCNTKGAKIRDKDDDDTSADDEFRKDSALKSAIELAIDMGTVSTSLLQRKLSLGYARAARIVDTMERMGVISQFEGSKPRRVLITKQDFIEMTMNNE